MHCAVFQSSVENHLQLDLESSVTEYNNVQQLCRESTADQHKSGETFPPSSTRHQVFVNPQPPIECLVLCLSHQPASQPASQPGAAMHPPLAPAAVQSCFECLFQLRLDSVSLTVAPNPSLNMAPTFLEWWQLACFL